MRLPVRNTSLSLNSVISQHSAGSWCFHSTAHALQSSSSAVVSRRTTGLAFRLPYSCERRYSILIWSHSASFGVLPRRITAGLDGASPVICITVCLSSAGLVFRIQEVSQVSLACNSCSWIDVQARESARVRRFEAFLRLDFYPGNSFVRFRSFRLLKRFCCEFELRFYVFADLIDGSSFLAIIRGCMNFFE